MGGPKTTAAVSTSLWNPFSLRSSAAIAFLKDCRKAAEKQLAECQQCQGANATDDCRKKERAPCDKAVRSMANSILRCQWEQISGSGAIEFQASAAATIFPSSFYTDPAGKTSDPTEPFGGVAGQLTATFHARERLSFQAWATYQFARPSGLPGTFLDSYLGGALQGAWIFLRFTKGTGPVDINAGDDAAKNYLAYDFIPGLVVGSSVQLLECIGANASTCMQNVLTQWSVTPFLDMRVTPALQFRLSIQMSQPSPSDLGLINVTPSVGVASAF